MRWIGLNKHVGFFGYAGSWLGNLKLDNYLFYGVANSLVEFRCFDNSHYLNHTK